MKRYLAFFFTIILATGCAKYDGYDNISPDYSDSYLPLAPGSTLAYIQNGDDSHIITATITSDSYFQDGRAFYGINYGGNEIYYAQNGNLYSMIYSPNLTDDLEIPILDDIEYAGYTLVTQPSLSYSLNQVPVETTLTIVADGFSKELNGILYKDVIHTSVDIRYPPGEFASNKTFDFYFARGIGIIEIDEANNGLRTSTLTLIHQ